MSLNDPELEICIKTMDTKCVQVLIPLENLSELCCRITFFTDSLCNNPKIWLNKLTFMSDMA